MLLRKKPLATKLILFTVILLLVMIVLNPYVFWVLVYDVLHKDDWKERTTPLPEETVQILCKDFGRENEHLLCSGDTKVFGPDFYPMIRTALLPETGHPVFYEDVEKTLGMFRTKCDPIEKAPEGWSYFRCYYDLRGDGQFAIGVLYHYPQNEVFDVLAPVLTDL